MTLVVTTKTDLITFSYSFMFTFHNSGVLHAEVIEIRFCPVVFGFNPPPSVLYCLFATVVYPFINERILSLAKTSCISAHLMIGENSTIFLRGLYGLLNLGQ